MCGHQQESSPPSTQHHRDTSVLSFDKATSGLTTPTPASCFSQSYKWLNNANTRLLLVTKLQVAVQRQHPPPTSFTAVGAGVGWEDADDEEEDEGWVVQTPFLPPPPSQPDQVEHWVRAMYADPNALASSGQQPNSSPYGLGLPGRRGSIGLNAVRAGLAATTVPLGSSPSNMGGMMSMERIRSLFSM